MWHVTHCGGWTLSQIFSSLTLTIWERQCVEDIFTKEHSVSQGSSLNTGITRKAGVQPLSKFFCRTFLRSSIFVQNGKQGGKGLDKWFWALLKFLYSWGESVRITKRHKKVNCHIFQASGHDDNIFIWKADLKVLQIVKLELLSIIVEFNPLVRNCHRRKIGVHNIFVKPELTWKPTSVNTIISWIQIYIDFSSTAKTFSIGPLGRCFL